MTPSEQARADALADAETLYEYVRYTHGVEWNHLGADLLWGVGGAVSECLWRLHHGDASRAALNAKRAAHAAFRAVPGLRG